MSVTIATHTLRIVGSGTPPSPTAVRIGEVSALPLFEGVEPALVESIASGATARQYRTGAVLLQQDADVPQLSIINRGIVELVRMEGDREFGVLLLSSKDLVMPSAAMFEESTLVTVRALTTTRTLEIDSKLMRRALEHSARLSMNLMKAMSGQWRMSVRSILDLNSRTAAQRLGAFLVRLTDLLSESGSPLVLPIPKRHLAMRLGITAETFSRTLQILASHGLHLRGRTIMIHDRAAIDEFCGPDPYGEPDERSLSVYAF